MVQSFIGVLRHHPEVTFFLVLGVGYLLGKVKLGGFTLGAVTGTLLAGVLIGQLGVQVSGEVKQCFFLLFLFSIGFRTGPQFFRGLRSDGLQQALLSAIIATTGLLVAYVVSRLFSYDAGTAAGVIAGALTESATIGTASDAIGRLGLPPADAAALINRIPVAFAVTYLIGVVGAAWFLAQIGPRIMGVNLEEECRRYEQEMGGGFVTLTTARRDDRVSRLRGAGRIAVHRAPGPGAGEVRGATRACSSSGCGAATRSWNRMTRPPCRSATSSPSRADGSSWSRRWTRSGWDSWRWTTGRSSMFRPRCSMSSSPRLPSTAAPSPTSPPRVSRGACSCAGSRAAGRRSRCCPATAVHRGDVLTIVGPSRRLAEAVQHIGASDRPSDATDMVLVAFGIVAGALLGIPAIMLGGIEIGLSLSVGVLLGGLVCGWLRSTQPRFFGRIPGPTLWMFESIGLAGFVAVVGLNAGPDFVTGLRTSGVTLIVAGLLTVLIPHLVGIVIGRWVFKMQPGVLLGVCAGAGTATPALAAIQETAKSAVPTLGYGVSYAVGNVLLAVWGTVIVALLR